VLASQALATSRWSYKASHAHARSVSLPAVVAHERHRGGNSAPLDFPVGDITVGNRSGPVTEVQRRIGIAVHQLPAPGADPHVLAEAEVGQVAAAAVVGLGGSEPAASDHQPPAQAVL